MVETLLLVSEKAIAAIPNKRLPKKRSLREARIDSESILINTKQDQGVALSKNISCPLAIRANSPAVSVKSAGQVTPSGNATTK